MAIVPTPPVEIDPRLALVFDIAQIIEDAIQSEAAISAYDLAGQIAVAIDDSGYGGDPAEDSGRAFWTNDVDDEAA